MTKREEEEERRRKCLRINHTEVIEIRQETPLQNRELGEVDIILLDVWSLCENKAENMTWKKKKRKCNEDHKIRKTWSGCPCSLKCEVNVVMSKTTRRMDLLPHLLNQNKRRGKGKKRKLEESEVICVKRKGNKSAKNTHFGINASPSSTTLGHMCRNRRREVTSFSFEKKIEKR